MNRDEYIRLCYESAGLSAKMIKCLDAIAAINAALPLGQEAWQKNWRELLGEKDRLLDELAALSKSRKDIDAKLKNINEQEGKENGESNISA